MRTYLLLGTQPGCRPMPRDCSSSSCTYTANRSRFMLTAWFSNPFSSAGNSENSSNVRPDPPATLPSTAFSPFRFRHTSPPGYQGADVFLETGRKDIICPLPGGMRRKCRRTVRRGRQPAAPVGQEKTLLIDRLRPACSLGSMTCLPGIAPGGQGVRRLRGRVRVPKGQGHAPNPRLGEGAPQPHAIT